MFIEKIRNKKEEVIYLMNKKEITRKEWKEVFDLQGECGCFLITSTHGMPNDAYIEFIHHTSAYITGRLINELLKDNLDDKGKDVLKKAFDYFSRTIRAGHGYYAIYDQMETMNIFLDFNVLDLFSSNEEIAKTFMDAFESFASDLKKDLKDSKYHTVWGGSYKKELRNLVNRLKPLWL